MAYLDKAITKLDATSSSNQYFTFVNSSIGGPEDLKVNANIAFNPSLNTFIVEGNLIVNGTTTTLGTQDLVVEDKNIIIGNVETPSDTTANGGGITLKGATDKTFNWVDSTDSWTSSENINLASGKLFKINGTNVLNGTNAYVTADAALAAYNANNSDKLDNQDGTYYLNWENFTNKPNNFSNFSLDNTDLEYAWVGNDGTSLSPNSTDSTLKFVAGAGTNVAIDSTNNAIRFSHSDTSSVSSLTALTGANVISDLDFDQFGHTTLISTRALTPADIGAQPAFTAGSVAESTSSVLTITNGAGATLTNLGIQVKASSGSQSGYLSSADWLKFNNAATNASQWNGGSTGLVAATGRTSLGATTVGSNIFTLANPSAIRYLRTNADNTVTAIDGATLKAEIGLGNVSTSVPANTLVLHTTGATNVTFPTSGTLATTSQITTVNDGALALTVSAAASGQGVVLGTGTGFTANEPAGTVTYDIDVGPALTSLATIMNGATTGFLKKTANDTYAIDSTVLTSASTLDASKLSGTIPSTVLGNSNVYIGNTAVALNRGTGVLSLTGINIDGNAGYATTAGSTTNSITAGNGITGSTFNGGSAQTWSIVSAAGSAGTIGTISVAADTVGVSLGTTGTVAAAGDHGHGNILTGGTITAAAVAPANTDYILISDASNSGKVEKSIAIGTGTTTYLRNDGTWATPADTNTDTLQSISNIATAGTYYPSFVSATGAVVGYVAQDKLKFNPSTGVLSTTYLSGAMVNGVTTITASTYTADKAYPIILVDATTPASITISLPAAASSSGLVFRIKKTDGSAHPVILDANGTELIDGAETFTLIYQYQAVDLACNGTAWYIL